MRVGLLPSSPRGAHGLAAWAGRIGATATDTNETALQKRLAVVLCAGTLPFTTLWSAVYLLMDAPLAAVAPAGVEGEYSGDHVLGHRVQVTLRG